VENKNSHEWLKKKQTKWNEGAKGGKSVIHYSLLIQMAASAYSLLGFC
jgi:hypothetical protein